MNHAKSEKKYWILLRGLARGSGHWGSFSKLFESHHPGDEFEYLDIPGNGLRFDDTSPLNISDYVKDLRSHSRFIKEKKSVQIVALSMGGMIATEWMHRHPHEVTKAYLVCTSSAGHSRFYERFRPQNLIGSLPLLKASTPEEWEKTILAMITNNEKRRQEEFPAMVEFSRQHPVKWENVMRQLLAASRYRFPKKAPGDVVLIGSHADRFVSPSCTLNLGKAWGIEPFMNSSSGHDIPIDEPRWLVEHLL